MPGANDTCHHRENPQMIRPCSRDGKGDATPTAAIFSVQENFSQGRLRLQFTETVKWK